MLLVGCTNRSEHPGIYDLADREAFAEAVNTGVPISTWEDSEGVVRLRRDLNLKRWRNPRPVGAQEAMPFRGTFDGGNYTISGLQLKSDGLYAGGVIGLNGGLVRGCKNEASVRGTHYAGGVAGANNPAGRLDEIDNTGQVQAETIGYIVGEDFSQQVVDEDILREHYHREHNQ